MDGEDCLFRFSVNSASRTLHPLFSQGTGGALLIRAGSSVDSSSGQLSLSTPAGGEAGASGSVQLSTGATTAMNQDSGDVAIRVGAAPSGSSGGLTLQGGSAGVSSGDVSLLGGDATLSSGSLHVATGSSSQGNAGGIALRVGTSEEGSTGAISIAGGDAYLSSGSVTLQSGASATSDSGAISIGSGAAPEGDAGGITLSGGAGADTGDVVLSSGTASAGDSGLIGAWPSESDRRALRRPLHTTWSLPPNCRYLDWNCVGRLLGRHITARGGWRCQLRRP